jgi:hypothetical protein
MNCCIYAVSLTYHLDVSRSNNSGIKCKVECIIIVSRQNFSVDCSGLEPKTEKDGSSTDISELPSKGDRFESLHECLLRSWEFLWFLQSFQAFAGMILVAYRNLPKPLITWSLSALRVELLTDFLYKNIYWIQILWNKSQMPGCWLEVSIWKVLRPAT